MSTSQTAAPTLPDFTPMIEAARTARRDMLHQLAQPILSSVHDAGVLAVMVLCGVLALALLYLGLRSGELVRAVWGIAGAALLALVVYQLLSTTTASWSSAALGFMFVAVALSAGGRGAARLLRFLFG